ncbi:MAG: TAXI family TRAP transporter solute-binding subunit [Firmicutes bacterium]|nr:TAXI family TRAP transporter solute-binding subunit [Bacillota bacterium]
MSKKRYSLVVLSLMLVVAMVAVAGCSEELDPDAKYGGLARLSLGASSVGSSSYNKLTIWSSLISDELDVDVTPEGTAGSVANVQLVHTGELEISATTPNLAREGLEGTGFAEGTKMEDLRLVLTFDSFVLQFFALESSGISSIEDLEGKHINLSRAGSGTDTWARRVLEAAGITPDRISNLSPGEANDLMRDGGLDASAVMGSIHPSIIELNASHDLNVFGVGDFTDEFILEHTDMFKVTMDGGIYEGIEEPFVTAGEISILIASSDLPEDFVYDMVKTTYENKNQLASGYEGFATIDPEDIGLGMIPLHPGAYRYYEELGLELPAEVLPID